MNDTAHVKGLAELDKMLKQLPEKIEKNIMRSAMRAGAKVIMLEAKQLAPVAPPSSKNQKQYSGYAGALRDSIRVSTPKLSEIKRGTVAASVKVGGKQKGKTANAYYARWVEYGTAAHYIKAKKGGSLSFGGIFAKGVLHPGAKPNPFMRPAADNASQAALMAIGQKIKSRLTKAGIDSADDVELSE